LEIKYSVNCRDKDTASYPGKGAIFFIDIAITENNINLKLISVSTIVLIPTGYS